MRRAAKGTPRASVRKRAGSRLVVVPSNDGLVFDAVTMLFLDDGRALTRLALLDYGAFADAVAVVIPMALANGDAGADRSYANADFVSQCRNRKAADGSGNQQILPHCS